MFHNLRNRILDNGPIISAAVFSLALIILGVLIGLSATATR